MKIEVLILFLIPMVGLVIAAIIVARDKRSSPDHKVREHHL